MFPPSFAASMQTGHRPQPAWPPAQQLLPDLAQKTSALGKKLVEPVLRADRSPVGLDAALESSCLQETRNVWLEAGFQAWYAWFCADSNTRAALSDSDLRKIAHSVCSIKSHDTVQALFEHLFYKSYRGDMRRRKH